METTVEAPTVTCAITGEEIPPIPRSDNTVYRGLSLRYRGFFDPVERIAISVAAERGSRVSPRSGAPLVPLREEHVALIEASSRPDPYEALPEALRPLFQQLWTADSAEALAPILDATDDVTLQSAAAAIDLATMPTNPASTKLFEHNDKDERYARMVEAGMHLLANRPDSAATEVWWEMLLAGFRSRLEAPREDRAPLDDSRDPFYLVGPLRQLLVQAGNQLLKQKRPRDAKLCFATVLSANPELTEVHYAHAVAANNVVAQPGAGRFDRQCALRAFDGYLRTADDQRNDSRYATISQLRRQLLGMRHTFE